MSKELRFSQQVERSINKKYRKSIWNNFVGAVKRYELIQSGDKIAVCVSGGKDSMLLAKLMQMLQRYSEVPFELVFLAMNPGYNVENTRQIELNAARLEIPLTVFETDIFDVTAKTDRYPCYLCPVQVLKVSGNSAAQVLKVPVAEQVHSAEQVLYSVPVQKPPPEQAPPSWVQA